MDGTKPTDGLLDNPPKNLEESAQFSKEKVELLKEEGCRRLDEVLQGVDMELCRFPTRYPIAVESTNLRTFVTRSFKTVPSFKIWYTFTEQKVILLHIELAEI